MARRTRPLRFLLVEARTISPPRTPRRPPTKPDPMAGLRLKSTSRMCAFRPGCAEALRARARGPLASGTLRNRVGARCGLCFCGRGPATGPGLDAINLGLISSYDLMGGPAAPRGPQNHRLQEPTQPAHRFNKRPFFRFGAPAFRIFEPPAPVRRFPARFGAHCVYDAVPRLHGGEHPHRAQRCLRRPMRSHEWTLMLDAPRAAATVPATARVLDQCGRALAWRSPPNRAPALRPSAPHPGAPLCQGQAIIWSKPLFRSRPPP